MSNSARKCLGKTRGKFSKRPPPVIWAAASTKPLLKIFKTLRTSKDAPNPPIESKHPALLVEEQRFLMLVTRRVPSFILTPDLA
uniref:Uncharacterized protein n=1 Tax=Romanomermis culicivorax TaxID=13658 RepID=A0A915I3L9_ROMCU